MSDRPMTSPRSATKPRQYPTWFIRTFWVAHRAVYRLMRGRLGLWRPSPGKWGAMRLATVGRRGGQQRVAILGYFEDGPNLVTMAMNGWMGPDPAWWLNLEANPVATVELGGERRTVHARAAEGDERARLWATQCELDRDLDGYAATRPHETAVVILEPVSAAA